MDLPEGAEFVDNDNASRLRVTDDVLSGLGGCSAYLLWLR
jgi:hypothetical protein